MLEFGLKLPAPLAMEQEIHMMIVGKQSTFFILLARQISKTCTKQLHVKYLAKTLYFCSVINEFNDISVIFYVSILTAYELSQGSLPSAG